MSKETIYPINSEYRLRKHELKCDAGIAIIWDFQKFHVHQKTGKANWTFVANDRDLVSLVNRYIEPRGIFPDAENADLLASLI